MNDNNRAGTAFLIAMVAWLPIAALNAWALQKIWNWYLPIIFGVPELTFAGAVGVSLVIGFLTATPPNPKSEESALDRLGRSITFTVFKPLFGVFAAWAYLTIWPII